MRLNPDCVRDLLLYIEDVQIMDKFEPLPISLIEICKSEYMQKYSSDEIAYTIEKLKEANFLKSSIRWNFDCCHVVFVDNITYQGHQFLETVRNPKIYREIKTRLSPVGSFTIDLIKSTALNIIPLVLSGQLTL